MRLFIGLLLSGIILIGLLPRCTKSKAPIPTVQDTTAANGACDSTKVLYCNVIKTLVETNCATSTACHVSGATIGDFTSYPGLQEKAVSGKILLRVFSDPPSMPPSGPLSSADTTLLGEWLRAGAPEK